MYFVSDTHALLWYLVDSPQLSPKAKEIFDIVDRGKAILIVPAIVLLECIDIIDKKKVRLDFEEVIVKINQASNFILAEVNWGLILEVSRTRGFKDLHDRVIVATANVFDATLISRDATIKKLYSRTIW